MPITTSKAPDTAIPCPLAVDGLAGSIHARYVITRERHASAIAVVVKQSVEVIPEERGALYGVDAKAIGLRFLLPARALIEWGSPQPAFADRTVMEAVRGLTECIYSYPAACYMYW